jgi:hypothetical protein
MKMTNRQPLGRSRTEQTDHVREDMQNRARKEHLGSRQRIKKVFLYDNQPWQKHQWMMMMMMMMMIGSCHIILYCE